MVELERMRTNLRLGMIKHFSPQCRGNAGVVNAFALTLLYNGGGTSHIRLEGKGLCSHELAYLWTYYTVR